MIRSQVAILDAATHSNDVVCLINSAFGGRFDAKLNMLLKSLA